MEAILLTHWHDDHIAGASKLVDECPNAIIAIPATLQSDEFLAFLEHVDPTGTEEFSSGVEELRAVLKLLTDRGIDPRWSLSERRISGGPAHSYEFEALSPSDADITEFLSSVKEWLAQQAQGGRIAAPNRNDSSVAAVLTCGNDLLLFGADLEVTKTNSGWDAVHKSAWKSRGTADFLKIPHHGSKNAHHTGMWSDMVTKDVHAALTPWNKNRGLPTEEDVQRIRALTVNAYAASQPLARKSLRRMPLVDNLLRNKGIRLLQPSTDIGHLRVRKNAGGSWVVDMFGVGCVRLQDWAA